MKKTLLGLTLSVAMLTSATSVLAAPIAVGGWTDYEYYQADTITGGNPGQFVTEGESFYFFFDLAFLGTADSNQIPADTNSDLTLKNDVEGYGDLYGTIPIQNMWAAISIFSIDPEMDVWNPSVLAYYNDVEYNLGFKFTETGDATNSNFYTGIVSFGGSLLDTMKIDPYGELKLLIPTMPEYFTGTNDFNLLEVGVGVSPVPEPATMLLFGTGLIGLAGVARRRKVKK